MIMINLTRVCQKSAVLKDKRISSDKKERIRKLNGIRIADNDSAEYKRLI